jgi:hypothetical protein
MTRKRLPRIAGGDKEQAKRSRRASQRLAGESADIEQVNITGGIIPIEQTTAPKDTTDKLYNKKGDLYWENIDLTTSGTDNYVDTFGYTSSTGVLKIERTGSLADLTATVALFAAATASVDGERGLVVKPVAGEEGKFLKGNATWGTPTNTQLTNEQVQDIVGAMFTSNTETRITVTYQDADGTIDLVVDALLSDGDTIKGGTWS